MISAIVLAAGMSTRMGTSKMLLPWGNTTVIGKVVHTLSQAGITDIRVVAGGTYNELKKILVDSDVQVLINRNFTNGEMLTSIQVGLDGIGKAFEAILVVLGDQPQIETQVVQILLDRYVATRNSIIVPSYKMHRGHPWLLGKSHWQEIKELKSPLTLHDFLNQHNKIIDYVNVNTPSILQDLDTQTDYLKFKP